MSTTYIPWLHPDDLLRLKYCPRCDYCLRGLPAHHRCPECGFEYDEQMFDLYGWTNSFEGLRIFSMPLKNIITTLFFCTFLLFALWSNNIFNIFLFTQWMSMLILLAISAFVGYPLLFRRSDQRPPVAFLFTGDGYCAIRRRDNILLIPWSSLTQLNIAAHQRKNRMKLSLINESINLLTMPESLTGVLELDAESSKKVETEISSRIYYSRHREMLAR